MGDVTLVLKNKKYLELKDCLYVPKYRKNLILVSRLNKSNYLVYFNKNVFIWKNDSFICSDMSVDNIFYITLYHCYLSLKMIMPHLRGKYLALIRLIYGIYT